MHHNPLVARRDSCGKNQWNLGLNSRRGYGMKRYKTQMLPTGSLCYMQCLVHNFLNHNMAWSGFSMGLVATQ